MFKKGILVLFILLHGICCFSYEKQNDEYSCGAFCAYNLIDDLLVTSNKNDLTEIYHLLKTNNRGTTTYNLCKGLDKYFSKRKIPHNILYCGIKKVKTYKIQQDINLEDIDKLISSGYRGIINIGIYKKTHNRYIRQYGHYVNLICVNKNGLTIFDPYDKEHEYFYWKIKNIKAQLQNINDNEKYENTQNYILIDTLLNYLEQDECAIINGIVFMKCDF